jgi:hypothetical protein
MRGGEREEEQHEYSKAAIKSLEISTVYAATS